MCGNEALFSDLDTSKKVKIEMADKTAVWTQGKGTVCVLLENQHGQLILVRLKDVHYIPGAENCLSVKQLIEYGFDSCVDFNEGILHHSRGHGGCE